MNDLVKHLVKLLREGVADTGVLINTAANVNATMYEAAERIEQLERDVESLKHTLRVVSEQHDNSRQKWAIEMDGVEAELAECRKDAERYRFIKDMPWCSNVTDVICHHQNAAWDRVIDAAMEQQ